MTLLASGVSSRPPQHECMIAHSPKFTIFVSEKLLPSLENATWCNIGNAGSGSFGVWPIPTKPWDFSECDVAILSVGPHVFCTKSKVVHIHSKKLFNIFKKLCSMKSVLPSEPGVAMSSLPTLCYSITVRVSLSIYSFEEGMKQNSLSGLKNTKRTPQDCIFLNSNQGHFWSLPSNFVSIHVKLGDLLLQLESATLGLACDFVSDQ